MNCFYSISLVGAGCIQILFTKTYLASFYIPQLWLNSGMEANKENFHLYNTELQPFASSLRKEMTKSEACLWKYVLKGRKLRGYSFRRQRPVLRYIADFMCMELMLIIEVDGVTHDWDETSKKDQIKNEDLERAGFTVIRFSDEDVLKNINQVVSYLEEWIDNKVSSQKCILVKAEKQDQQT